MEVTHENLPEAVSILLTKVNHLLKLSEQNNRLLQQSQSNGFYSKAELETLFHVSPKILKTLVEQGKVNEYAIGKRKLYKAQEFYDAITTSERRASHE